MLNLSFRTNSKVSKAESGVWERERECVSTKKKRSHVITHRNEYNDEVGDKRTENSQRWKNQMKICLIRALRAYFFLLLLSPCLSFHSLSFWFSFIFFHLVLLSFLNSLQYLLCGDACAIVFRFSFLVSIALVWHIQLVCALVLYLVHTYFLLLLLLLFSYESFTSLVCQLLLPWLSVIL